MDVVCVYIDGFLYVQSIMKIRYRACRLANDDAQSAYLPKYPHKRCNLEEKQSQTGQVPSITFCSKSEFNAERHEGGEQVLIQASKENCVENKLHEKLVQNNYFMKEFRSPGALLFEKKFKTVKANKSY